MIRNAFNLDTANPDLCEGHKFNMEVLFDKKHFGNMAPSKIEWDLTNEPLRKLLGLLDTQV